MNFTRYIALGDAISMDLYPALDAGETDIAVALERLSTAGDIARLGAASLLFQNDERHWPDEVGDDLSSLHPGIDFMNLASDDATIGEVFGEQLSAITPTEEPVLVTLTIGGNDLLSARANRPNRELLARITSDIAEAYELLIDAIRRLLPNSTLIATTCYDPTDRTGKLPGMDEREARLPLEILDEFNAHVRKLASGTPGVLIADAYAHFLGHGASAAESDQWYWRRAMIMPNAKGAHQLRLLWLEALRGAGAI